MESNTKTMNAEELIIQIPSMYAVVFYNDDITTMEFVTEVLIKVFHKQAVEASAIMMHIHQQGHGVAGIYTYDVAVTKKSQTDRLSAERGFPLRLAVEEAD